MTFAMFDSVDGVSVMPYDPTYAYAGYVNGNPNWRDYESLVKAFPGHNILSISVNSFGDADCLDIEKGDATNTDAPGWLDRQFARGNRRPALYTSASNVNALATAIGSRLSSVRIWSAHYGAGMHICGPSTCRLTAIACHATQWTDKAFGRNLDQSLCGDDFFSKGNRKVTLNKPVVGAWPTISGAGYWLVAADGGVFAFGDAQPFDDPVPAMHLAAGIVGGFSSPTGKGLTLVAADGGVFCLGDAKFEGSIPGLGS